MLECVLVLVCTHTYVRGYDPSRAHDESQSRGHQRVNLFLSLRTKRVVSSRISALQGGAHKSARYRDRKKENTQLE